MDSLGEDEIVASSSKKKQDRTQTLITCIECKQDKPHKGKRMCSACYQRMQKQLNKLDESKKTFCIECNQSNVMESRGMCKSCYVRTRKQNIKLDMAKHKSCVGCNKTKPLEGRGMCKSCYDRIFINPTRKAKRLAAKNDPLRNHKPKLIPKVELQSESEDDFEQSKDISSDDEEDMDSKIGIKMEIKCEPSTYKQ